MPKSIYPSVDEMTNLKTRDKKRKSKTLKSDKEKIEEAVRLLDELEINVEKWKQGVESGYTMYRKRQYVEDVLDTTLSKFSRIKKILDPDN